MNYVFLSKQVVLISIRSLHKLVISQHKIDMTREAIHFINMIWKEIFMNQ